MHNEACLQVTASYVRSKLKDGNLIPCPQIEQIYADYNGRLAFNLRKSVRSVDRRPGKLNR